MGPLQAALAGGPLAHQFFEGVLLHQVEGVEVPGQGLLRVLEAPVAQALLHPPQLILAGQEHFLLAVHQALVSDLGIQGGEVAGQGVCLGPLIALAEVVLGGGPFLPGRFHVAEVDPGQEFQVFLERVQLPGPAGQAVHRLVQLLALAGDDLLDLLEEAIGPSLGHGPAGGAVGLFGQPLQPEVERGILHHAQVTFPALTLRTLRSLAHQLAAAGAGAGPFLAGLLLAEALSQVVHLAFLARGRQVGRESCIGQGGRAGQAHRLGAGAQVAHEPGLAGPASHHRPGRHPAGMLPFWAQILST